MAEFLEFILNAGYYGLGRLIYGKKFNKQNPLTIFEKLVPGLFILTIIGIIVLMIVVMNNPGPNK